MELTKTTIHAIAGAAAVEVLRALGVSSGELNYTQAAEVYGKWFEDAVKAGRLKESHRGEGKTGRRWFSVADILVLKADETMRAEAQLKTIKQSR